MKHLKENLLNLDIVEDNEFLDKYVQLIQDNSTTPRVKRATQQHHIVPQCYYVNSNIPVDNTQANKVNLFYRDHILAHYYLTLCGKGEFSHSNAKAFRYMINNKDIPETEKEAIKLAEHYQEVYSRKNYKGSMLGKHLSEEARSKVSESRKGKPTTKGRISIIRNGKQKYINPEELDIWESSGWEQGSIIRVPKFRWMTDGVQQKQVLIADVDIYIENGWKLGGIPMSKEQRAVMSQIKSEKNNKGKIAIHNSSGETKFINSEELPLYQQTGWIRGMSDDFSEKISRSSKGRSFKRKAPMSAEERARRSERAKQRAYVSKNGICKTIKQWELDEYLSNGWKRGRIS